MIELEGTYNKGKIIIDHVDSKVISQLKTILNAECFANTNIAVMPDCHMSAGGAMVGFTMTLNEVIVPSLVGVDIGCGVIAYNLGRLKKLKAEKLDKFIRKHIPIGMNVHEEPVAAPEQFIEAIERLEFNQQHILRSIASLGGGNHFIEVGKDEEQNFWLIIHTGSRNFGFEVAQLHLEKARKNMKELFGESYKGFEYLSKEEDKNAYFKDLAIAQEFASFNRQMIAKIVIEGYFKLDFDTLEVIESVHNYIDLEAGILRKGAISAREGEKIIIPMNMAYGCVIGSGKSGKEYNYSAPHGAGRIMSRTDAVHKVTKEAYEKSMKGIFTTSVSKHTLDESPMVYKKPKVILENIKELVDVEFTIKPVYNLKAEK